MVVETEVAKGAAEVPLSAEADQEWLGVGKVERVARWHLRHSGRDAVDVKPEAFAFPRCHDVDPVSSDVTLVADNLTGLARVHPPQRPVGIDIHGTSPTGAG